MKARYRLIRRGVRGGAFYCVDTGTGKRTSLGTNDEDTARQIIEAKNNAVRQPAINLQIAKAYIAGSDNGINTRTWRHAIEALIKTKQDSNRERWLRVTKDKALCDGLAKWTRRGVHLPTSSGSGASSALAVLSPTKQRLVFRPSG